MTQPSGLAAMKKWLDDRLLAHPPVPAALAPEVQAIGENLFGTREDVFGLYADPTLVLKPDDREYLLLEYDGRGLNDYALSYFLVTAGVAAYVQIGLGGQNMDNDRQRRRIGDVFTELGRLVEATAGRRERLVVFAWDVVGKLGWCKPGEDRKAAWSNAERGRYAEPADPIREALAWVTASGSASPPG